MYVILWIGPGPIVVYSDCLEEVWQGGVTLNILYTMHILLMVMNLHASHRREVLKQWAANFSLSVRQTFAFATSETVSIASGNRLIQAVRNVSIFWMITFSSHDSFCTGWFDPEGIEFNVFPTMSEQKKRLEERMCRCLAWSDGPDGQRCVNMHNMLNKHNQDHSDIVL
jgi:hypothetical protein